MKKHLDEKNVSVRSVGTKATLRIKYTNVKDNRGAFRRSNVPPDGSTGHRGRKHAHESPEAAQLYVSGPEHYTGKIAHCPVSPEA